MKTYCNFQNKTFFLVKLEHLRRLKQTQMTRFVCWETFPTQSVIIENKSKLNEIKTTEKKPEIKNKLNYSKWMNVCIYIYIQYFVYII